jgi:adenylate kinase
MVIIVTGTPGTGKTTYAKQLAAKLGYTYLDLTEFIINRSLHEGKDPLRDTLVVDEDALLTALLPKVVANPEMIVDGHYSHVIPREHVAKCYVLKCELKELERRLKARGYSDEKVRENLDAEIFDTCLHEAEEYGHNPEVIWTSTKPTSTE